MVRHTWIAHYSDDGQQTESVHDHLTAIRDLSAQYGTPIGLTHVAGLAGWLHDAGKYSDAFQDYIRRSHEGNPSAKRGEVNHAFAGGQVLNDFLSERNDLGYLYLRDLIANVIMAHHNPNGPYDYLNPLKQEPSPLVQRIHDPVKDWSRKDIQDTFFTEFDRDEFSRYVAKAHAEILAIPETVRMEQQAFILRFIASCLIDADHLETGNFMSGVRTQTTDTNAQLIGLQQKNEQFVAQMNAADQAKASSKINMLRHQMSELCFQAGQRAKGIYSLSVPTGGGKTYASLRFALTQAKEHGMDHVIIVIPYNTIIEQNAKAIRDALGLPADDDHTVLEYHSTISNDPKSSAFYYAQDTWDAPIIMTSQVAYLNALYGHGSKNLRHMHRLVNSVLIYDEIQSMPLHALEMNNHAINWLSSMGSSTPLLCTATQPELTKNVIPVGINPPTEIVPNIPEVETAFKRVRLINHIEMPWSVDDLTAALEQELTNVDSVLVIFNTKRSARMAYQGFTMPGVDKCHLSTAMYKVHRQCVMRCVNKRLKRIRKMREAGEPVRHKMVLFATQLVEAGVDFSFDSVFRSLAGVDSIVQAAGRCNRNHERPVGDVHLMRLDSTFEHLGSGLRDISYGADITKQLLRSRPDADLFSASFVRDYFVKFLANDKDRKLAYPLKISGIHVNLLDLVAKTEGRFVNSPGVEKIQEGTPVSDLPLLTCASQTVAKNFEPIDSQTTPVLPQWGRKAKKLVLEIESGHHTPQEVSDLLRRAQDYVVQVYTDANGNPSQILKQLVTHDEDTGIWIADERAYSSEFGLSDPEGGLGLSGIGL
jgi:CRISPR-associated endonuclease/helicase Cas3